MNLDLVVLKGNERVGKCLVGGCRFGRVSGGFVLFFSSSVVSGACRMGYCGWVG